MTLQRTACRGAAFTAAKARTFSTSGRFQSIGIDHAAADAQRHPKSAKARLNRSPLLSLLGITTAVGVCLGANYFLLGLNSSPHLGHFDKQKFTKCTIVEKVPVSSTAFIYTIRPPWKGGQDEIKRYWETGLWSLEFKQPQLQVARSYTPLPPREGEDSGELRFLIRRLHGGEMSNYLSRLKVDDEVEMRGPAVEYALRPDDRNGNTDIVFLAGGTGISSALQAVHCFLGQSGGKDRMTVLWANRKREDCAGAPKSMKTSGWFGPAKGEKTEEVEAGNEIMREIRELQKRYPGRVDVKYFIDEENSFITPKAIKEAVEGVDKEREGKRKLLMASGPDGFMEYFVGKKGDWVGTQQLQGRLGGIVKSLDLKEWVVVKL